MARRQSLGRNASGLVDVRGLHRRGLHRRCVPWRLAPHAAAPARPPPIHRLLRVLHTAASCRELLPDESLPLRHLDADLVVISRCGRGPAGASNHRGCALKFHLRRSALAQPRVDPSHAHRRLRHVPALRPPAQHPAPNARPSHPWRPNLVGLPHRLAPLHARRPRLLHLRQTSGELVTARSLSQDQLAPGSAGVPPASLTSAKSGTLAAVLPRSTVATLYPRSFPRSRGLNSTSRISQRRPQSLITDSNVHTSATPPTSAQPQLPPFPISQRFPTRLQNTSPPTPYSRSRHATTAESSRARTTDNSYAPHH